MTSRALVRFAAFRRHLAAVLCMVVLLANLHPAHATTQAMQSGPAVVAELTVQAGNEGPAIQDALIDHVAFQCGCKVTSMPVESEPLGMAKHVTLRFEAGSVVNSSPAAVAPPQEPPRT